MKKKDANVSTHGIIIPREVSLQSRRARASLERRLEIQLRKQQRWRRHQQTAE